MMRAWRWFMELIYEVLAAFVGIGTVVSWCKTKI